MKRAATFTHEFVEFIPPELKEGTVYVSVPFSTVVHKCFCACGSEVVTPLSPTDWKLIFNGETVSLDPSIGNWSLDCQSHYWLSDGKIMWADRWSPERISAGRYQDRQAKQRHFGAKMDSAAKEIEAIKSDGVTNRSLWQKVRDWIQRF